MAISKFSITWLVFSSNVRSERRGQLDKSRQKESLLKFNGRDDTPEEEEMLLLMITSFKPMSFKATSVLHQETSNSAKTNLDSIMTTRSLRGLQLDKSIWRDPKENSLELSTCRVFRDGRQTVVRGSAARQQVFCM